MGHGGTTYLGKELRGQQKMALYHVGVVAHLASFEELDAVVREEEVALGPLRQPDKKKRLLSPSAASRSFLGVERGLRRRRAIHSDRYCMHGIISWNPKAVLSFLPLHPHDFTNYKRWPHLPFCNHWQLYIRWKVKFFLRRN